MAEKNEEGVRVKKAKDLLVSKNYELIPETSIKCSSCGKIRSVNESGNFIVSNSPMHKSCVALYKPTGKNSGKTPYLRSYVPYCRDCLVNNRDFENINDVIEVLRYMDKPYIKQYWESAMSKFNGENQKSILGNYSKVLAPNAGDRTFKDSESWIEIEENVTDENSMIYSKEWRGSYSQLDLDYLNGYLADLKEDFNILTKNHIDYAKKIAKASFATDKAYDEMMSGGSDKKYKELQSVFDSLSKSAQFAESGRSKSSVSNGITDVVEAVENKLWIYSEEKFKKDDMDVLLDQFGNIDKSL